MTALKDAIVAKDKSCKALVDSLSDQEMVRLFYDTGGHDIPTIIKAFTIASWGGRPVTAS